MAFKALAAFAPAKVNLYLHVAPPDAQGMHPLASLMVFADVGDRLVMRPVETGVSLTVGGRFAPELADLDPERNLVVRAARRLCERAGVEPPGLAFDLDKALPSAAGLGGGSSDAGAALRLTARALGLAEDDARLAEVARELGADGVACLAARPATALGLGEVLTPAPVLPPLSAVLVNCGAACPTGAVYRGYDDDGARGDATVPPLADGLSIKALVGALEATRNDLQAPAAALVPEVGETLALVAAEPLALFTRLSGSGATVFALCRDAAAASALAERLVAQRPRWWVRPCRLGGPWSLALTNP